MVLSYISNSVHFDVLEFNENFWRNLIFIA